MKRLSLLLATALLAACAPPVAQVPTATPAPAPTATPAPADDAIGAALAQTAGAGSYTLDLAVTGSGAALGVPTGGQAATLASLQGTFAGDDFAYTFSGAATALLTGDPAGALRAVRAGGESFVRGPIPLLGAMEDAWYRLAPEQALLVTPPISVDSTAGALARSGPDFSGFAPGSEELAGGQRCRRYTGGREPTLGLLQSLAASGLPVDADPAQIDRASSAVLICEDGYLHALDLAYSGARAGERPAPYSYDLRLRLADFDAPAPIEPPEGARDLPTPTR